MRPQSSTRRIAIALHRAGLLFAAVAMSSACGGLVDYDSIPPPITDGNVPLGTGGGLQAACAPAQWDCAGQPISCEVQVDAFFEERPVITVGGRCRCDFSRPAAPSDCQQGELFVCGSLAFSDGEQPDEEQPDGENFEKLNFEPVSCRCIQNSGYYCSHCVETGLYSSVDDAAGCGLVSVDGADSDAVYCGCGQ